MAIQIRSHDQDYITPINESIRNRGHWIPILRTKMDLEQHELTTTRSKIYGQRGSWQKRYSTNYGRSSQILRHGSKLVKHYAFMVLCDSGTTPGRVDDIPKAETTARMLSATKATSEVPMKTSEKLCPTHM
jgi:hypothetical protein